MAGHKEYLHTLFQIILAAWPISGKGEKIIKSELSKLGEPKLMVDSRAHSIFFALHGPTLLSLRGNG